MDYQEYTEKYQKCMCAKCGFIFDDDEHVPEKLGCFHIFCNACIPELSAIDNNSVICPLKVCKDPVNQETAVDHFTLSRAQKYLYEQDQKSVKCKGCPDNLAADFYCPECNHLLCEICQNSHKRNLQSRNHHVQLLENIKNVNTIFATNLKCPEHKGSSLNYFCKSQGCRKAVCTECLTFDHKRENVIKIKEAFDENKENIASEVKNVDDKLNDIVVHISLVEKEIKNVDSLKKQIDGQVGQSFKIFSDKLQKRKKTLLESADITLNKKRECLNLQLDELEMVKANFDNILLYASNALMMADTDGSQSSSQSTNKAVFLNLVSSLEQRLVQMLKWELSLNLRAKASLKYDVETQVTDFTKLIGSLGKFSDENLEKELKMELEKNCLAGFEDFVDPGRLIGNLEEDSYQMLQHFNDTNYQLGASLDEQYPSIGKNLGPLNGNDEGEEIISTLLSEKAELEEKLELYEEDLSQKSKALEEFTKILEGNRQTHDNIINKLQTQTSISEEKDKEISSLHETVTNLEQILKSERSKSNDLESRLKQLEINNRNGNSDDGIHDSENLWKATKETEHSTNGSMETELKKDEIMKEATLRETDLRHQLIESQSHLNESENLISELNYRNEQLQQTIQEKDDLIASLRSKVSQEFEKSFSFGEPLSKIMGIPMNTSSINSEELFDNPVVVEKPKDSFAVENFPDPKPSVKENNSDLPGEEEILLRNPTAHKTENNEEIDIKKQLMKEFNEAQRSQGSKLDESTDMTAPQNFDREIDDPSASFSFGIQPSLDPKSYTVINNDEEDFDIIKETSILDSEASKIRGQLGRTGGISNRRPPSKKYT